jgi:CDP-diacylglycerol---glycerol-3-phosphate 3-phosphatidyltransferase
MAISLDEPRRDPLQGPHQGGLEGPEGFPAAASAAATGVAASAAVGVPVSPPPLSRHALHPSSLTPPTTGHAHFWNLPNTITVGRALAVPLLLLLPWFKDETGSALMAWIFIAAAVSDLVDGWLARRGQMVTHVGKLLDPLADKLLVSTALVVLLSVDRIPPWAVWMVAVIVGRELAVTGLRGIASAGGHVVAANGLGKLKTVTQNIAIGALLFHYPTMGLPAHAVGMVFLTVATGLTIASGYAYFAAYFRRLKEGVEPDA